jgi:hypothetical protein
VVCNYFGRADAKDRVRVHCCLKNKKEEDLNGWVVDHEKR